jgi:hypothetical protein
VCGKSKTFKAISAVFFVYLQKFLEVKEVVSVLYKIKLESEPGIETVVIQATGSLLFSGSSKPVLGIRIRIRMFLASRIRILPLLHKGVERTEIMLL